MIVEKLESPWYLARAAARHFVACSLEAVAIRGLFTVALSGGSTPRSLYEVLADPDEPFRELVPWSNTHFFWSDERHVPPDHPDSNYRMAHESMLSHVPLPKDNIHRIHSENPDPAAAAQAYEETIKEVTGPIVPQLDLILLGLANQIESASDTNGRVRDSLQNLNQNGEVSRYVDEMKGALMRTYLAVEASGLKHNELWSYEIVNGKLKPIRYGASTDVQLWNVTDLAVQFVLKRLSVY